MHQLSRSPQAVLSWLETRSSALLVGGTVIAAVSFFGGRMLQIRENTPVATQEKQQAADATRQGHIQTSGARDDRNGRVHVQNLGFIPFLQAEEIISAASPAQRARWAKEITAITVPRQKVAALWTFFRVLIQTQPDEALELIETLGVADQSLVWAGITKAASPSTLPQMATQLWNSPQLDRWLLRDVLEQWSRADPAAVAEFVAGHTSLRNRAAADLLYNWAQIDPSAAEQWFDELPESAKDENTVQLYLFGKSAYDETSALEYAVLNADKQHFVKGLASLVTGVFLKSPEEARAWILRTKNSEAQRACLEEIGRRAEAVIVGGVPPGTLDRPGSVVVPWLAEFPDEVVKSALMDAIGSWGGGKFDEMMSWVNTLSRQRRDEMLYFYCASRGGGQEPQHNIETALLIRSAGLRKEALEAAIGNWLYGSPRHQLSQIAQSNLSPELKKFATSLVPAE